MHRLYIAVANRIRLFRLDANLNRERRITRRYPARAVAAFCSKKIAKEGT